MRTDHPFPFCEDFSGGTNSRVQCNFLRTDSQSQLHLSLSWPTVFLRVIAVVLLGLGIISVFLQHCELPVHGRASGFGVLGVVHVGTISVCVYSFRVHVFFCMTV